MKRLFVDDSVVISGSNGRVKLAADRVDPIGRLGGSEYVTFGQVLDIPRPP